jgi:uncharacterized protein
MSRIPLMPKATAVWLVENTGLTFRQIADFCHLHELEVKGIADGDVAAGIKGMDPITGGQLTREEIEKGEKDTDYRLKILESKVNIQVQKATSGPRYTPSPAAATGRTPSPGSCAIIRNCRTQPS